MNSKISNLSISAIRCLCIDTIAKAKSGHPGMALGSAPILYTLFTKHLVSDPQEPNWVNRDRFVLSAGHASSLLYAMLHLCGYGLTIEDLKSFRQIDSLTPGHPEYKWTRGVDATSGPLGQGIAQAVGMAVAQRTIAAAYPHGDKLMNHYTYCLCGDGCLQEGISQEAISFAGHHKLNKLILIYDSNNITLDGGLDLSFSESVKGRFIASGWDVLEVKNGNDVKSIDKAITTAKTSIDKPTLIIVKTVIGYGSVNQGTNKVHGSPLGENDIIQVKEKVYGYNYPEFTVPAEVYKHFSETFVTRGVVARDEYFKYLNEYGKEYPIEKARFLATSRNDISEYLPRQFPTFATDTAISTRAASQKALNDYMLSIPNFIGGSADVASSVMTKLEGGINFAPATPWGHNVNWGIREFAMASIQNGILLHGGLRTYVGCFLVFADYMKAAIRMAALSHLPAIYLFSHDSIAVGEDGPTHQPIEQLAMLRSIPNVNVIRPCDIKETYGAYQLALLSNQTPTALILSRQNLPVLEGTSAEEVVKGGYVVSKEQEKIDYTIIATGSEVSLAVKVQGLLLELGIDVRVVSMPCVELFEKQKPEYQQEVLGTNYENVISIEALTTFGWHKWAKHCIGINTFGASAPMKDVFKKFGFTEEGILKTILEIKKASN